jgi:hypothetical protein
MTGVIDRRRLRAMRKLARHVRSGNPGRLHLAIVQLRELEEREGGLTAPERNLLMQAQRKLAAGA